MLKSLILALSVFVFTAGAASGMEESAPAPKLPVSISLKKGDSEELATQRQLERLLALYDVSPWVFTNKIVIDSDRSVVPHSHPVLTLSTRHFKDDELLLATFIHENLHWFMEAHPQEVEKAVADLKVMFPKVPVGYPEGAQGERSTYEHLLVGTLEYDAVKPFLGELRARQVIDFWTTDHYTWIYRTILERGRDLRGVLRKHGLNPTAR